MTAKQLSAEERVSHYGDGCVAAKEGAPAVEMCRHCFHRYTGQPACLHERSDSNKAAFTPSAAEGLLQLAAPAEPGAYAELIASCVLAPGKTDLKRARLDVLFPANVRLTD